MEFGSSKIKHLWIRFFIYSVGIVLTYSAFGSLLSLQSSLNVVDNVGTITTAILFGTCLTSCISVLPLLFRGIGARKCLIWSICSYVIFTSANFHPEFYTMIPAAIVVGLGDGILWSTIPIYVASFADMFEKFNGTGEQMKRKLFGYFFAMFQMSKIFGNSITYTVFQVFCVGDGCNNSSSTSEQRNVTHCGANDCQDPNLIQEDLNRYIPDGAAKNVILSMMICMYLTAIVLYVIFLPHAAKSSTPNSVSEIQKQAGDLNERSQCKFAWLAFKDALRHMITYKQLLLTPGTLYGGLIDGFVFSEMTRAFTSCIFGVSWVSVHLMIYGISATLMSTLCAKLSKCIRAIAFIYFAATVDVAMYTYYLCWTPNPTTQWYIIPAYICAGITQGVWKPQSTAIQTRAFPDTLEVGSTVWTFWWTLGMCLQFAISPLICVNVKIIIHLSLLGVALIGFVSVEKLLQGSSAELLSYKNSRAIVSRTDVALNSKDKGIDQKLNKTPLLSHVEETHLRENITMATTNPHLSGGNN